jgi:N-glycosidase YbiA
VAPKQVIRFYRSRGEHGYLSNFSRHPFSLQGKVWPTVEHYFQAQKFKGTDHEEMVRRAKGAMQARKLGRTRSHPIRGNWDAVREDVMYEALQAKFTQHAYLMEALTATADAMLVEDSPTDSFWGCGRSGDGKNRLGVLLMRLRGALGQNQHQNRARNPWGERTAPPSTRDSPPGGQV